MSPLMDRTRSPGRDGGRHVGDGGCIVQDVGDVIAHAGQRAKIDLGEAQPGDRF